MRGVITLLTVLLMLLIIILVTLTFAIRSRSEFPKLKVSLIDIRLTSPQERPWRSDLEKAGLKLENDMKQLEVDFEISNTTQKRMCPIGVYSKKLNSLALGMRDVNDFPISLGVKKTIISTIRYLIREKDMDTIKTINPERDFKAYAVFSDIDDELYDPRAIENSWRGNPFFARLFGIGYSKVVDARNK